MVLYNDSIPVPVCNANNGDCSCLPGRLGKSCDYCSTGNNDFSVDLFLKSFFIINSSIGFYALPYPNVGCTECDCDASGTLPATTCDPKTGQCVCKKDDVANRRCDGCAPGYYRFDPLIGG